MDFIKTLSSQKFEETLLKGHIANCSGCDIRVWIPFMHFNAYAV